MGYYIYHNKFSHKKSKKSVASELIENAFNFDDLNLFEKYFQNVEIRDYVDSIILFDDNELVLQEKHRFKSLNGIFVKNDLKSITEYINSKKYNKLIREESLLYDGRIVISFYKIKTVLGYYTTSIFEHPFKDCHFEFYNKYQTGNIYSKLEIFKEACNLEFDKFRFQSKSDFEYEMSFFKQNMIDKFEFGKVSCFISKKNTLTAISVIMNLICFKNHES